MGVASSSSAIGSSGTSAAGLAILDSDIIATNSILESSSITAIEDVATKSDIHPIESDNYLNTPLDKKYYAGNWYQIASYPLNGKDTWGRIPDGFYKYEAGKPCPRMSYKYVWNRNNKFFLTTDICYLSTNNYKRNGKLIIPDYKKPRKLLMTYNILTENRNNEVSETSSNEKIDYYILATDYNDYSIVKIHNREYPQDEYRILVLSRKKSISKNEARGIIILVDQLGYEGNLLEAHPTAVY